MRWLGKGRFRFFRDERGFSLIEVVVALGILGVIAVAFLSGLSTTSKAVVVGQERVIAESLAKSQVEHIRVQDYIPLAVYDSDDPEKCYELIDIPGDLVGKGYDVEINPPKTIISPGEGAFELQSIRVVIKRNGEGILTISVYRCGSSI